MGLVDKLFGNYSKKELKKIEPMKQAVLDLEEKYSAMDNKELSSQTQVLRDRIKNGETLDDVLVNRLYDTAPQMEIKPSNKGYDYQVEFATFPDKRYYDVKKYVLTKCPLSKYWERILLYLDMVSICSLIRYKNRRKNH